MAKYIHFAWNISAYHPEILQSPDFTDKELRREYSRLRKVAEKRIKRMGQTEWARSKTYQYNVGIYPNLVNVPNKSELSHLLSDLARFLSASTGSISGLEEQRTKALESLKEAGLENITTENWWDFVDMMEWIRDQKQYDPSSAARMIDELQENDQEITRDNFKHYWDLWQAHKPLAPPEPGERES